MTIRSTPVRVAAHFRCAVCHTNTWRAEGKMTWYYEDADPQSGQRGWLVCARCLRAEDAEAYLTMRALGGLPEPR